MSEGTEQKFFKTGRMYSRVRNGITEHMLAGPSIIDNNGREVMWLYRQGQKPIKVASDMKASVHDILQGWTEHQCPDCLELSARIEELETRIFMLEAVYEGEAAEAYTAELEEVEEV